MSEFHIVFFVSSTPAPEHAVLIERVRRLDRARIAAVVIDETHDEAAIRWPLWMRWSNFFFPPREEPSWRVLASEAPCVSANNAEALFQTEQFDLGVHLGGAFPTEFAQKPASGTLTIHPHDPLRFTDTTPPGVPELYIGEKEIAVTAVFRDKAGEIISLVDERRLSIERFDDEASLGVKCGAAAASLILKTIDAYLNESTSVTPIDPAAPRNEVQPSRSQRAAYSRKVRRAQAKALIPPFPPRSKQVALAAYQWFRLTAWLALAPWTAARLRRLEAEGRAPVVILYYHGVGDAAENWMALPMIEFHRQVQYMRERCDLVSLEDALARLRSGQNHRLAAALTFDDGYENFYHNALPYLEANGVPAAMFVCPRPASAGEQLGHDVRFGYHFARLMTPGQIRETAARGVTIGSHSTAHEDIGSLKGSALEAALRDSAREIEEITERPVQYLSFPFGHQANLSEEAIQVGKTVYDAVFSAYGGYNPPDAENRFHFQRIANPTNLHSLAPVLSGIHRLKRWFYSDRPAKFR
ncbi:MAG: polysaccharide deacetylase family protein [bacterium]|nr:polysaccharide deacetylase family protein [bacterium]